MLAAGAEDDSVMVWDLHQRRPEGKAPHRSSRAGECGRIQSDRGNPGIGFG